jgi:hypothetical protein
MSENTPSNHSSLFRYLSETEQESLVAGQNLNMLNGINLSFQNTNIETSTNNNLSLPGGGSMTQNTKYKFSQITIGYSLTFSLPFFSFNKKN